jgi:ABC-type phosphate transport system ATPase subunit
MLRHRWDGSMTWRLLATNNRDLGPARVSQQCAFFLAEQGTPGHIVEHGPTDQMFNEPIDPRTADYVNGRFG